MPPHVLVDFVVLPPGHGRSVTDIWGWDAHKARLSCPDDMSGGIGVCNARRALKLKLYQPPQTMVNATLFPFRENSHGRTRYRSRDLIISRQRLCPLEHEAGHMANYLGVEERTVTDSFSHVTNFGSFSGCRLLNGFREGESFVWRVAGVWGRDARVPSEMLYRRLVRSSLLVCWLRVNLLVARDKWPDLVIAVMNMLGFVRFAYVKCVFESAFSERTCDEILR